MTNWSHLPAPARLRERVSDAPDKLWVRGDESVLDKRMIAVVGPRSATSYGHAVARSFARAFAAADVVVVSGLARGIDAEAHKGALESGQTIAVLGCGIDRIYPARHAELDRRIELSGAVVSEYGPGVEPAPWRFPARNRIIAGLADAVVIVEAREYSGALITVNFALDYGVPVFAVPGEITSALSVGTNDLLRRGLATIAVTAQDVLAAL